MTSTTVLPAGVDGEIMADGSVDLATVTPASVIALVAAGLRINGYPNIDVPRGDINVYGIVAPTGHIILEYVSRDNIAAVHAVGLKVYSYPYNARHSFVWFSDNEYSEDCDDLRSLLGFGKDAYVIDNVTNVWYDILRKHHLLGIFDDDRNFQCDNTDGHIFMAIVHADDADVVDIA